MRDFILALRNGFGFLSTIPVGITMEGIENLMKHIYLFPVVGTVIGIILAFFVIALTSLSVFSPLMIPLFVIVLIYYITGFNHIDGLADFGDGLAAHGTKDKKIAAMRDTAIGTGGIVFCMIALIGLFVSLESIRESEFFLPFALIVAETSAKQSMVTVAAFGRSLHAGFGAMTVNNTKPSDLILGTVFSAAVCYVALGVMGLSAFIVSQLAGLLVLNTANRHFGGVSGDVVGASNEIGRLAALLYIGGIGWTLL